MSEPRLKDISIVQSTEQMVGEELELRTPRRVSITFFVSMFDSPL